MRTAVPLAERVRAALLFVSRRDAPLANVYATDAAADPLVKIAGVFTAGSGSSLTLALGIQPRARA